MNATQNVYVITLERYCITGESQKLEYVITLKQAYKDKNNAFKKINERVATEIDNGFVIIEYYYFNMHTSIAEVIYKDNFDGQKYRDIYTIHKTIL